MLGRRSGERTWTHAELVAAAQRGAAQLCAALPSSTMPRIAVVLRRTHAAVASLLSVWLAGGCVVLLAPPRPLEDMSAWRQRTQHWLEQLGVHVTVEDRSLSTLERLHRVTVDGVTDQRPVTGPLPTPTQEALITQTSGSTGEPRPVLRSHGALLAQARAHARSKGGLEPGVDHRLGWGPLHRRALGGDLLYPLATGVDSTLLPADAFAAEPLRWLRELSRRRATFSTAPTFAYQLVAQHLERAGSLELDLHAWRTAHVTGELADAATLERFTRAAAPYGFDPRAWCVTYGCTEIGNATCRPDEGGVRVDRVDLASLRSGRAVATEDARALPVVSVGPPTPGNQLRIMNAAGTPLGERTIGRIQVRTDAAIDGYLDDQGPDRFQDGWFDTGDEGYLADGELFVLGRADTTIIVRGTNLPAEAVERLAATVPGVAVGGCAAIGVARQGTQALVLLVETNDPDPTLRDRIMATVGAGTGHTPQEVVLCDPGWLPRTDEGKLQRSRLVEDLLSDASRSA